MLATNAQPHGGVGGSHELADHVQVGAVQVRTVEVGLVHVRAVHLGAERVVADDVEVLVLGERSQVSVGVLLGGLAGLRRRRRERGPVAAGGGEVGAEVVEEDRKQLRDLDRRSANGGFALRLMDFENAKEKLFELYRTVKGERNRAVNASRDSA